MFNRSTNSRKSAKRNSQECCVQGCETKVRNNSSTSAKLYRFPRDEILVQEWKSKLQIQNLTEAYRVCGNHFTDADFNLTNLGWRILSPSAIPSRNIPSQPHGMNVASVKQVTQVLPSFVKEEPLELAEEDAITEGNPTKEEIFIKEEPVVPADDNFIIEGNSAIEGIVIKSEPTDEDLLPEVIKLEPTDEDGPTEINSTSEEIVMKVEPADDKVIRSERSVSSLHEASQGVSPHEISITISPDWKNTGNSSPEPDAVLAQSQAYHVREEKNDECEMNPTKQLKYYEHLDAYDELGMGVYRFCKFRQAASVSMECFPFCTECGREFNTFQALCVHVQKHGGREPWICHLCLSAFMMKKELEAHITLHTQQRPFNCIMCRNLFASKTNLEVHSKIHISENPFVCDLCGVQFALSSALDLHSRKHQQTLLCTLCPRSFPSSVLLHKHMNCHKPKTKIYHCPLCNDAFSYDNLMKHIKNFHSDQAKHKCPRCSEEFMTQKSLRVHLKRFHLAAGLHAGNRFICIKCKSKFSTQALLDKHSVIHTKLERRKLDQYVNSGDQMKRIKKEPVSDDVVDVHNLESTSCQLTEKSEDGDEFCCIECGEQCQSSSGLTIHYEKHVKEEEGALRMEA